MAIEYKLSYTGSEINEKLGKIDDLAIFVTPQMFGAKADGVTDDTSAINEAINSLSEGSTLYFPDGTYLVRETDSTTTNDRIAIRIDGKNRLTLLLSDRAVIKHAPSTSAYYRTIRIDDSTNITIRGGHLVGELDSHTPEYNDDKSSIINTHGYGIRVIDSYNITIDSVDISKYYGDPIVLCSEDKPYNGCQNVKITHCTLHDSVRNGLTVTSCQGLLVQDCEIYNITGAMPMAGIDIEGEYAGAANENIIIEGCNIHDNGVASIDVVLTTYHVHIRNCQLLNTFYNSENAVDLVISNCTISNASIRSDCIIQNSVIKGMLLGTGCDCLVTNCRFDSCDNTETTSLVSVGGESNVKARFVGCTFFDPEVQNVLYYTIRTNTKADKLAFNDCVFYLRNAQAISPFGNNCKVYEFTNCQFIACIADYTKQFVNISGDDEAFVSDCVFDASAITNYNSGYSSLVKVGGTNTTVKNCIIKANSAVSQYAFHSGVATGNVYYINNILPAWSSIGYMPTSAAKLVIQGNVLSDTSGSEYLTVDDMDSIVSAVIEALPAAEEAGF